MTSGVPTQPAVKPGLLFVLSCCWVVVSLAGGRLAATLGAGVWYDVLRLTATAAMLLAGFYLMAMLAIPDLRPLSSIGLVRRPGLGREFGVGAALGWGLALSLLLPAILTGNLHLQFHWNSGAVQQTCVSACALGVFGLAMQLILSGLPVRLLVRTLGQGWTVLASLLMGACLVVLGNSGQGMHVLYAALALCLPVVAFLRTRAMWLPLGLQIGFMLSQQLLFGMQSPYAPSTSGVVEGQLTGAVWLTGGLYGPETSAFAVVLLLLALLILQRVTRDYAWHYTYQPAIPGGYPMDVPPPAEHLREAQLAAPAPLVQIGAQPAIRPAQPPGDER